MRTVLLARHGETTWNRERRIQGWAPTPLTDRGREEAAALGDRIDAAYDVDLIRSSDLLRARETVEEVGRAVDAPAVFEPAWRERDFGEYQGLTYEAAFEGFPEVSLSESGVEAARVEPASGERMLDMRDRVIDGWGRLLDESAAGKTVLVVTHGGPLYVLLGWLRGRDLVSSVVDFHQDNCALSEIRIEGGEPRVVREGEV